MPGEAMVGALRQQGAGAREFESWVVLAIELAPLAPGVIGETLEQDALIVSHRNDRAQVVLVQVALQRCLLADGDATAGQGQVVDGTDAVGLVRSSPAHHQETHAVHLRHLGLVPVATVA
ncbi:hypothetical protein D3C81_1789110 [compost metagenome]